MLRELHGAYVNTTSVGPALMRIRRTPPDEVLAVLVVPDAVEVVTRSTDGPVLLNVPCGQPSYWFLRGRFYATYELLAPDDVLALATERENRKRLKLERAHAALHMSQTLGSRARRRPIPLKVKTWVWQRDGGRCVECRSRADLEYDHIIPLAMGGSNTERNLQLLCGPCNRRKGATLG
jgi:5-methylcytosine-specific restriction endonuclease McrA